MNLRKDIVETIKQLKKRRDFKSQADVAEFLGYNVSYFSRVLNSDDIPLDFEEKFFNAFPKNKYLNSNEDFLSHIPESKSKENSTTKDALSQLDRVRANKENGKPKNSNEGILEKSDQLIPQKVIDVPIKGFAGLQKAFFSDDYIQNNFVEVIEYVKPDEKIQGVYFRVKVEKNNFSMQPTLNPGETTWSQPISDQYWNNENIFKKDKVYSLWHPYRGILFKRIIKHNIHKGLITLSSDNADKENYEDEEFSLSEFRKILIVRKKEVLM